MYFVNEKFKSTKTSHYKKIKIIKLFTVTILDLCKFYYGHVQCIYFEFPKNLQEAEAFIREMRNLD